MAVAPGVSSPAAQAWSAAFPPQFQAKILTTIVGGSPFSRRCTPLPTARSAVAFGILDANDPAWLAELDQIPDLSKSQGVYEVAVSKLAGTLLISQESIDDSTFPLTTSVSQVLEKYTFSHKLDADLIGAAGPAPTPTGILSVATAADGADLYEAAIAGKAAVGQSGGTATCIALSPHFIGEVEAIKDTLGRPVYPDAATTFAGMETVSTVAATEPFVFDPLRCWLVLRNDFLVQATPFTDSAWSHYAQSMRVIGRFALAVPQPLKAVRKLTVAGVTPSSAARSGERK